MPISSIERADSSAPDDEVIALFGEIHRRLEPRDQVEERSVDPGDRVGQRALQLIEGGASLQRRHARR